MSTNSSDNNSRNIKVNSLSTAEVTSSELEYLKNNFSINVNTNSNNQNVDAHSNYNNNESIASHSPYSFQKKIINESNQFSYQNSINLANSNAVPVTNNQFNSESAIPMNNNLNTSQTPITQQVNVNPYTFSDNIKNSKILLGQNNHISLIDEDLKPLVGLYLRLCQPHPDYSKQITFYKGVSSCIRILIFLHFFQNSRINVNASFATKLRIGSFYLFGFYGCSYFFHIKFINPLYYKSFVHEYQGRRYGEIREILENIEKNSVKIE